MATPACTLTEEQIRLLYKAVSGKIIADKNNGVNHDPENYMKQLYEKLRTASGGSDATAMDYIQHIPRMLLAAKGTMSDELSDYLSNSGVDLNKMDRLRVQFKDIENVKTFLNVNKPNAELEAAKEIISDSLPDEGVVDGDKYSEIEKQDEKKKSNIISAQPFDALPETGFALVNQEAKSYDGVEAKQNIPDPDPKVQTYFALVRMLNKYFTETGKLNADDLGIHLTPIRDREMSMDDLYVRDQKYFSTDDAKKTAEQKQKDREEGDGLLLVYTDKKGNPLYFDKEGNITTKEAGGTIAYAAIRRVYTNRDGSKVISKVQSVNDLAKKPGALSKEEIQKGRNLEIELLEKMRKYVINNPEEKLVFSVRAGQNGYVKEDFSQRNKISSLDLEGGFTPTYSPIDDGMSIGGGVYFTVAGYDMPVLIKRPKFSELPDLVEALSNLLFNSSLDNAKKIQVIQQFLNNKKTDLFERDGKLFIKLENSDETLDVSDKNNQKAFADKLNELTVNINKDLLGGTFEKPVMENGKVTIKNSVYNNFISDNFYTNLQANAEGKILKLNAYNTIQPTAEVTEKLFSTKAAPVTPVVNKEEEIKKLEAERDRKIEEEAPIKTLDYPLCFAAGGEIVNPVKISELLKKDNYKYLEALETIALNLAKVGVKAGYRIKQSAEAIKNILANPLYHGSFRDWEGKDIDSLANKQAVRLGLFFEGTEVEGIKLGYGVRFSDKKEHYTNKQIQESNALQEKLEPNNWSTKPEMGYVATLRWAQMKLAGETNRSLGEFLLDTQKEIRDDYQSKINSIEGTTPSIEQSTPSDNPVDVLKQKLKDAGRLLKSSTLTSEATDEQIAAAERWYNSSPLSKHVPFQVLLNVVNSNASAEFTLAGITLFAGSNYTDLYHEGWHVFSQLFLTKQQKQKLYTEARNLKGSFTTPDGRTVKFSEAEDIDIEEFMAEDFRKFVLSNGKKIIDGRSARNNIFAKIYNFLKELFKGQSYTSIVADMEAVGTIKDLYQKLYLGQVNDYMPSLNNVQFTLLNKGIQVLGTKEDQNNGLSYQDSMTLVQTIDSELAQALSEFGVSVGTVFTDPELTEAIYNVVKQRIQDLRKNLESDSNGAKIIDFGIANWGSFKEVASGKENTGVLAFHKLRSDFLTFDEKYAEMSPNERDVAEETKEPADKDDTRLAGTEEELRDQFGQNVFERKGNESSVFSMASNETVYLIKSLPAVDRNGKIEKNSLGSAKLVDFNRTWGIVINAVAGSLNKSDMYKKLLAASAVHPELKALVERLKDPSNIIPEGAEMPNIEAALPWMHMWTKFHSDFSVYRIPITEVQVIREMDKGAPTGAFEIRFVESDPVTLQVERNFNNSFQTSRPGEFISRTPDGVNKLEVSKVLTKFPRKTLFEGNNAFNFLRAIGFYLTDNAAVKREILNHKRAIDFLYTRVEAMENENKVVTNPLWSLGQAYTTTIGGVTETKSESGRVQEIMRVEGKYSSKYSNNSITNVQGDQEYDLSLNNSITQMLKELNDVSKDYKTLVSQPHMAHLNIEKNPFAKYSIILNSLFDLPVTYREINAKNASKRRMVGSKENNQPTALNIVNLNGIKNMIDDLQAAKESKGGIKTTSLDINSKFLMDLHSMLESGVMELTRRASKSSAFGVGMNRIYTKFNENDRTSYISTGYFNNKLKADDAAVELIKDKIAAEMERIAIVKTGMFDNIPGFKERGLSFTMFDDILTSPGLKEDLIKAANADNSFNVVNSKEFSQKIHDDVVNYLDKLYAENKALFDEMPFLSKQMVNKINNLSRKDGIIAKNSSISAAEAKQVAVRSFTVNALIHNMEIISILDGDLAMYNHVKEEYHKRNASITSTGRIFSTDLSDYRFINAIRKGLTYASKLKLPARSFNGILKSAVFGDNKVGSVYFNDYVAALKDKYGEEKAKKILSPYEKMTEGDGQGWITFDAYRELSLLEGSWSPKQDKLYYKILNEEKIDPEEIAEYFPPRKYQYAGPLKTSKLHIQAFHKFSLAPLIPSVIKGTNMEILHDNMVKQGFDYGLFESGSKLATITKDGNPDKFYTDKENRSITPWDGKDESRYAENNLFLQYLKNQVDINSKWKNKTVFSTQLRKLIINDLFRQGLPQTKDFEKLVTGFETLLDQLQVYKKQELLDEIGWTKNEKGEPIGDPEKFLKFVRKELSRQDLADHDISFVDLNDSKTGVKYDLSYSLNAEKIEKLLNAIVVKRLVRQKLNGEQLVQLATSGFESSGKFRKPTEEEIKEFNGTNDLPTYRPGKGKKGATTACKVKVAMKGDYYKLLELNSVKDYAKKNNLTPIQALNALIRDDKWLNKDDNRKLVTMVGVRIPVQGLNSMEFMEIYEFLPEEAGNVIILPSEIVAKSGGDFDIDKLTIFQPNYDKNKKHASYTSDESVKGTENKIIEAIRTILEHPENFDALIRPNDTDLVKTVADDLAKQNIQGYNPLERKNGTIGKTISATRCLEPRYNLYKHESNNVGKRTLGIGAVDNSYSSIFKRIGAYLNPIYTYRTWVKEENTYKEHKRQINIRMDHNKMTVDGQDYISLSDITTTTGDKVSDLISQLMNGWVDVEKDAWIFNINGNHIAGPVMLFLLEAGVDFKTACYFVCQPLVIDYIKERIQADSPFYTAANKGENQGKGLNKFNIRKKMLNTPSIISSENIYRKHIKPKVDGQFFTESNLFSIIKNKDKTSAEAKAVLAHFFELEDVMRDLTKIKLTMNVDTKPSKSFADAQFRITNIEGLDQTDIMPSEMITKMKTKSPISSFFIQLFQLRLFKPLMQIRADEKVNNYLKELIGQGVHENTFGDAEKFMAAYKNDIPLYLLQNHLKGIDLDNLKEYNSLKINKTSLPVQEAQLKRGAFVMDGVMYVDREQIKKDFYSQAFAKKDYEALNLHKLDTGTFSMSPDQSTNLQEYTHFVLEREYLRSITPYSAEAQTRSEYEKGIAQKALERTFNFYNALKGSNSVVNEFNKIKDKYSDGFVKDYMIFDELTGSSLSEEKGTKTFRLRSSRLDGEMANILHENLIRLSDPNTIKVNNPTENAYISRFFSRFIVSEYLRNGITKTSDSLAPILPTDMLIKLIQDPMLEIGKKGITTEMLDKYTSKFISNWQVSNKNKRNKFRNYLEGLVKKIATYRERQQVRNIVTDENGVNIYDHPFLISQVNNLLSSNPNMIFVIPITESNKSVQSELTKAYTEQGNFRGIPLMTGDSKNFTDETYDSNIQKIDEALNELTNQINIGADLAFPRDGLTITTKANLNEEKQLVNQTNTDFLIEKAPRTFEYLAKELYKRFGYIHPGAQDFLGFRDLYQTDKAISDKRVEDFLKECFGK